MSVPSTFTHQRGFECLLYASQMGQLSCPPRDTLSLCPVFAAVTAQTCWGLLAPACLCGTRSHTHLAAVRPAGGLSTPAGQASGSTRHLRGLSGAGAELLTGEKLVFHAHWGFSEGGPAAPLGRGPGRCGDICWVNIEGKGRPRGEPDSREVPEKCKFIHWPFPLPPPAAIRSS